MNGCEQVERELSAYLDGELAPAARAAVETHLAGCARCRQRLEQLRAVAAGVAELPRLQPTPEFLRAVRTKIARGEKPRERSWADVLFRPVWLKLPVEAVAVVAVLLAVTMLFRPARLRPAARPVLMPAEEPAEPTAVPGSKARPVLRQEAAEAVVRLDDRAREAGEVAVEDEAAVEKPGPGVERRRVAGAGESAAALQTPVAAAPATVAAPPELPATERARVAPVRRPVEAEKLVGDVELKLGVAERRELAGLGAAESGQAVEPGALDGVATVVVVSTNYVEVLERAGQLARQFNGRVREVESDAAVMGEAAERFFWVELPAEHVAAFRAGIAGAVAPEHERLAGRRGALEAVQAPAAAAAAAGAETGKRVLLRVVVVPPAAD